MDNNNVITTTGLEEYRKRQDFLFKLKRKYSTLLELDKNKRNEWILTNFVKKHFLIPTYNLTTEEIKLIPSIYRYRCYLYEFNENEMLELDTMCEDQMNLIRNEFDREIKTVLLESLLEERKKKIDQLRKSTNTQKIPIMLDLRIYGNDPTLPICFEDKVFELDDITKDKIKIAYSKVDERTHQGQKFIQMLNHSKILRNSYNNIKSNKK